MEDGSDLLFDAVLAPHRSLGRTGFIILMSAIAGVGLLAGIGSMAVGAWPVFAFIGLDAVLIYIAFRANYRSAWMYETVRLTGDSLRVERVGPGRAREAWRLQPYWLRVELDDAPAQESRLTLVSHGKRLVIGGFLTPAERRAVACALRAALARLRQPRQPQTAW